MSFNKNLNEIEKYNQNLVKKLQQHQFLPEIKLEFFQTQSTQTSLFYNEIPVHSEVNPEEEALDAFNTISSKSVNTVIILFGLGLGYLFKTLYDETKSKIVIFEPNMDISRLTMEAVDFSKELSDKRVRIASTFEELIESLSFLYGYGDTVLNVMLPSANQLYHNEILRFNEEFPKILNLLQSNFVTLFFQAFRWTFNSINNLKNYQKYHNVDVLKNVFKNKPAIIVSPGPSIDKTIEHIKKNRAKIIVFCVNIACKTLKKHGIKPDFVIVSDPYGTVAFQLDLDMEPNCNLIGQSVVVNEVFSLAQLNKRFIFYSNNDLFSRWISDLSGFQLDENKTKGTVSYFAMLQAYLMGCNPIILTGQDLAFSDNKVYSSTSTYGDVNYDDKIKTTTVMGQKGEILKTSFDYAGFIKYFEGFAAEKADEAINLINCSPGGAMINGYKNMDIQEVFEKLSPLDLDVNSALENLTE
ncbi:MAG: 6-hydroxymethylpterin diphosphokinase MptE-like protein, partial [Candidatus Gastranaerophilaceae bacterium]